MFSDSERVHYAKAQLAEVVCQLRFPSILRIAAEEPADFQERIRATYPRYSRIVEKQQPKLVPTPRACKSRSSPTLSTISF